MRTELKAGFVNFLANFYLIVVVPQLLNKNENGFDERETATAFVLTTFFASLCSGILSNLPVPCGPGLGGATFIAYSVLDGLTDTVTDEKRKEAFTICFLAGALMLILSPLAILLVSLSPDSVKNAIPVGLGMIFALNGFLEMELIQTDADVGLSLHKFSVRTVLAGGGLILIALLHQKGCHAGMLIPIVGVTLISWIANVDDWPDAIVDLPTMGSFAVSMNSVRHNIGKCVVSVIGLYLIAIFDIFGIAYGVSLAADLVRPAQKGSMQENALLEECEERKEEEEEDTHAELPGLTSVFVTCALSSVLASFMGITPVIALGESFAGVLAGGRTGLTAISFGVFTLLSLPFLPIIAAVPDFATSPVLVILGVNLMVLVKNCDFESTVKAVPSYLTIVLMPFLMSIDRAILAGLMAHALLYVSDFVYVKLFGASPDTPHDNGDEDDNDKRVSALERSTTEMLKHIRSAVRSPSSTPRTIPRKLSETTAHLMASSFHGKSPSLTKAASLSRQPALLHRTPEA